MSCDHPECDGFCECRGKPSQKRSEKAHRKQISNDMVNWAADVIKVRLFKRLEQKGFGSFVSRHEILGIIEEERYELIKAVHEGSISEIKGELADIAVGCIFSFACIESGGLDW